MKAGVEKRNMHKDYKRRVYRSNDNQIDRTENGTDKNIEKETVKKREGRRTIDSHRPFERR